MLQEATEYVEVYTAVSGVPSRRTPVRRGYVFVTNDRPLVYGQLNQATPSMPMTATANSAPAGVYAVAMPIAHDMDPKIPGTRIPVYRVTALLDGGLSVGQVAQDFPSLTESQIRAARAYALVQPPAEGISYPKESLKRLLRDSGFAKVDRELKKLKIRRRPK
jgi:uncharacterized protein (DUF433 family)